MTRNQIAALVETLDSLRLDKKYAYWDKLTREQQESLRLYIESWVTSHIQLVLRSEFGDDDFGDRAWLAQLGTGWTKAGLKEKFEELVRHRFGRDA